MIEKLYKLNITIYQSHLDILYLLLVKSNYKV